MTPKTYPEIVGPACAVLAEGSFLPDLQQTYRQSLEQDGVVFLTPELEELNRLSDAAAQVARGEVALEENGSPVNLDTFDHDAASELLRASRLSLINIERLSALAYFGLISRGGSLLCSQFVEAEGPLSARGRAVQELNTGFKHFVQLGIATEEWGRPWDDVVASDLEGEPVSFPLDASEVIRGLDMLDAPLFKGVKSQYFKRLTLHPLNLFNSLDAIVEDRAEPAQVGLAAKIAFFYRHSQQGCTDILERQLEAGTLSADIDWRTAIEDSVQRAGRVLDNS